MYCILGTKFAIHKLPQSVFRWLNNNEQKLRFWCKILIKLFTKWKTYTNAITKIYQNLNSDLILWRHWEWSVTSLGLTLHWHKPSYTWQWHSTAETFLHLKDFVAHGSQQWAVTSGKCTKSERPPAIRKTFTILYYHHTNNKTINATTNYCF